MRAWVRTVGAFALGAGLGIGLAEATNLSWIAPRVLVPDGPPQMLKRAAIAAGQAAWAANKSIHAEADTALKELAELVKWSAGVAATPAKSDAPAATGTPAKAGKP
jgi:hypothetical protein